MRTVERVLTGLLVVAVVAGAVAMVLALRAGQAPPPEAARAAAPDTSGYPGVPEATLQPAPEGWYVPEPTATFTPEPIIQTAEAVMALPTWTPLPTATATLEPTPVPTLVPGSVVVVINGTDADGVPQLVRFGWDTRASALSSPATLATGIWSTRDRVYGMLASPRGSYVAINSVYGDAGAQVHVVNVDDGSLGPRLPHDGFGHVLDWHPDGTRFLLQSSDQPGLPGHTFLLDASSAEGQSTLGLPGAHLASYTVSSASFSPAGDEVAVAYVDGNTGNSEVWLIALGGDGRLLGKTESERIELVDWSPRGDWIAMVTWEPGADSATWDYAAQLQLLRPDNREQVLLAATVMSPGPVSLLSLQWDPQGTRLAFLAGERVPVGSTLPLETSIRVWDADGGQIAMIAGEPHRLRAQLSWAGDRSRLVLAEESGPDSWALMATEPGISETPTRLPVAGPGLAISLDGYSRAVWLTSAATGGNP